MKVLKTIWHFSGSVYFAIILIASTALFVTAGTILESLTDSHKHASAYTYNHPIFVVLLWGFFINILVSALRRWPFKKRHIPFLVTHLGLLMILSGVMIKLQWGVQGYMGIIEGGESQEFFISDTYSLRVDKVVDKTLQIAYYPIRHKPLTTNDMQFSEFTVTPVGWMPHCTEKWQTWVKNDCISLSGYPPIPIKNEMEFQNLLHPPLRAFLDDQHQTAWNIYAVRSTQNFDTSHLPHPWLVFVVDDKDETVAILTKDGAKKLEDSLYAYAAGFGGYGVHSEHFNLSTRVTPLHRPQPPSSKWEENVPLIYVEFKNEKERESHTLAYDRYGMGLKWPVLGGDYRVRFQPLFEKLPYRIRLRQARQINYPNSSQPFSYESDLWISDQNGDHPKEVTLSMNNVYETWDGYRFYLANVTPTDASAVHRVQIVVNKDPAKYWLTYPGCFVLAFGIFLFFFLFSSSLHGREISFH